MSRANRGRTESHSPCAWEEALPAYVQGELGGEELERLEEHLRGCESCRQRAAEIGELIKKMKAVSPEPLRRDLAPDIMARIPETAWAGDAPIRRARGRRLWRLGIGALAASVAASVILAVLVGWLYAGRPREGAGAVAEVSASPGLQGEVRQEVVKALE